MAQSVHVAALLVERQLAAGRSIDKLQLHKLLYLVQGVHSELWDEPAFTDSLEAWRHGPVSRAVQDTYKDEFPGQTPITSVIGHSGPLADRTREVVDIVLERYGTWTGPNLESLVKAGAGAAPSPWAEARGDLSPDSASNSSIEQSTIARWFGRFGADPRVSHLTSEQEAALEDGDLASFVASLR